MADPIESIDELTAAQLALLGATRSVSEALPTFSTWLMAGFGAAFALILANIDNVSQFIDIRHIRLAILLFLVSVVVAVFSNYLAVVVKAGLAAQAEGERLVKRLKSNSGPFDIELFSTEYKRGLFPPISWITQAAMERAKRGDTVASARMIAKISQVQVLLVVAQGMLAVVAAGAVAFGMKLQ